MIVVGMGAYPDPDDGVTFEVSKRTVLLPDPDGVGWAVVANPLEAQTRMPRALQRIVDRLLVPDVGRARAAPKGACETGASCGISQPIRTHLFGTTGTKIALCFFDKPAKLIDGARDLAVELIVLHEFRDDA